MKLMVNLLQSLMLNVSSSGNLVFAFVLFCFVLFLSFDTSYYLNVRFT